MLNKPPCIIAVWVSVVKWPLQYITLCITLSIFRHAIKVTIALVPVTGPRRKRSQYWPRICAPGNTGMASHLGRRLMQMRNQYWPRAILQYCPRAILQYYPRSILQYWPRSILQYCPWSILASGLKLACDLNGRSYPNCLGHISMVNTETSSYMVLSH